MIRIRKKYLSPHPPKAILNPSQIRIEFVGKLTFDPIFQSDPTIWLNH